MLPIIRYLDVAGDQNAMRHQLAAMLGLDAPVPQQVLERAREDDDYARYLLRSRGHPELMEIVLAAASPAPRPDSAPLQRVEPGSAELLLKAGSALLNWARSGFEQLDPAIVERRLAACNACPYLREAPNRMLYKVTLSARSDQRVCGACGCTASRKANLPAEACPVEDQDRPGFTRWHEPKRAVPGRSDKHN